jgi:hypothetical protein
MLSLFLSIAFAVFSDKVSAAVYLVPPSLKSSLDVPCTALVNQHQMEFDDISIAIPYSG